MLILQTLKTTDENHEVECLASKCKLFGIVPKIKHIHCEGDLDKILSSGGKYDFIYLSAHGDGEQFTNRDGSFCLSWKDFALKLCYSRCMSEKCIVMLSCCRGGLDEVAFSLFYLCNEIQYVCGPRQDLTSCELSIAFHIFLFNLFQRNLDPIEAAKKVKKATGIRLVCFDRLESKSTESFHRFIDENYYNFEEDFSAEKVKEVIKRAIHEYNYGLYTVSSGIKESTF